MEDSIHTTARSLFVVMIVHGRSPKRVRGGKHDGLAYFELEVAGHPLWVTAQGAVEPIAHRGASLKEDQWGLRHEPEDQDT